MPFLVDSVLSRRLFHSLDLKRSRRLENFESNIDGKSLNMISDLR